MDTKVLVIEDDLEINELIGEYLSLESIGYIKAVTGKEGLALAERERPDAIVLDLMLPDIDGFEVVKTLASHRLTFDIPVVILSCMCQPCDREKALASGATSVMKKPFMPDDLIAGVRHAMAWRQTLKSRAANQSIRLDAPPAALAGTAAGAASGAQGIHQMVVDLFTQTDLPDAAVAGIREGAELLALWATHWNAEHKSASHVTLDYKIKARGAINSGPAVEWTLREDAPGMVEDAFFKAPVNGEKTGITSLIGWGGSAAQAKPLIMPPTKWLQVLSKTGATSFDKDAATKSVRFSRAASTNHMPTTSPMQLNGTR
jgi:two-component system, OmpR family, alkaline phosphatase synthesis response regulator PhoP